MTKKRIDILLKERGLAPSRERAQALIMADQVIVDDEPCTKPGTLVAEDVVVRLRSEDHGYVSRGALKLIAALNEFKIDVQGLQALDVGASTGGFTEVLLERKAKEVVALDVGHNQLDWKIRSNPKVKVIEKFNAKTMKSDDISGSPDVIVVDVSFISLTKIAEALARVSHTETVWITLIKPQFEVGPDSIEKGGIVKNLAARERAIQNVTECFQKYGRIRLGLITSPITGTDGNIEYLAYWKSAESKK
ncbi:MAG: TlyA family RNA methyltransferase [Xanthomonadaceae bacterium]|nr:TlyA family RNA methyltransferase [Xanthomonadaceae bacterium]